MLTKKELYAQASAELAQRRRQQQKQRQERLQIACSLEPSIAELYRQLSATSLKLSKAILNQSKDASALIEKIKNENLQTQTKIESLLEKNHLPADYLNPPPHCSICSDQGYVGHEWCACFRDLIAKIAANDFQRASHLKLSSFSSFRLDYYSKQIDEKFNVSPYQQMEQVLHFCEQYAKEFTPLSKGIFMMGKTGLGKTHLSLAIANEVLKKGFAVVYITASDLTRRLSAQYFHHDNQETDYNLLISSTDLLIIDDLGAEFESSFSISAVYDIINTRICSNRPTVVNTNLTPAQLQNRYEQRVVSRLFTQLSPMTFIGEDVRAMLSQKT